jgi:hypothetical protein
VIVVPASIVVEWTVVESTVILPTGFVGVEVNVAVVDVVLVV